MGAGVAGWVRAADLGLRAGGGIGPELLSLHIDMMPADVRAIFKSHLLTSESLKKSYQESKMTLGFTLADSRPQTAPNSDFLTSLSVRPIDEKIELKGLVLNLAPRSGEHLAQRQKMSGKRR